MALEDLLKEAASKGMTHFTIYPVPSEDGKTTYWVARASPSTQHHYIQVVNIDPAKAAEAALASLPRASRRNLPKMKPDTDVTVAVNDGDPDESWKLKA